MRLLDYFDHVYVINLKERVDRRKLAQRELRKLGADDRSDKVTFFSAVKPAAAGGFISPAVRGCFDSHLAVLKEAQARRYEKILIAEDDFLWSPPRIFEENDLVAALQNADWDLVWLGHSLKLPPREKTLVLASGPPDCGQSHFYAVKGRCVADLVEFLQALAARAPGDPMGGPMHYDGALTTYRHQRPDRRCLIAIPSMASQRMSRSDIHTSRWDRVPVVRAMIGRARRVVQVLRPSAGRSVWLRRARPFASRL